MPARRLISRLAIFGGVSAALIAATFGIALGVDDEPIRKLRPEAPTQQPAGDTPASPSPTPAQSPPVRQPEQKPTTPIVQPAASTSNAEIDNARKQIEAGKLIEARTALTAFLKRATNENDALAARDLLGRIANVTLFSSTPVAGDTLVEIYTIKPNDRLVSVAKPYNVPHDVILRINGIADARKISAGKHLKIPQGPFNAKISLSHYRLDLYLQDVYVRSFPVGLGRSNGTPTGEWRVSGRQENPTYYPSESAGDKRVIAGDDPSNPLGEYWIALEGISGEAVGKRGFGIHGTIDPQSIGKSESLGCVRMLNEDVAWVYSALQPGKSIVTIER